MPKPLVNPFAVSQQLAEAGISTQQQFSLAAHGANAYATSTSAAAGGGWGASGLSAWGPGKGSSEPAKKAAPAPEDMSEVDLGTSNSKGAAAKSTRDISAREAAVAQKEAALAAKESELAKLEKELARSGKGPRKNWPVCFPFVHHDIAKDVPPQLRGMVRQVYICYLCLVVCLLYQLFGASVMLGMKNAPDKTSSWFLSIIYVIAGVPLALVLWYLKLYNAAASDGALGYFGFFLFFAVHTAFSTWAAIAVPLAGGRWSFTGFVAAMRAFDIGKFVGIIYIVGAAMWTLEALYSFWCLKTVYFSFRNSGKQQQANSELSKIALKAAMENKV